MNSKPSSGLRQGGLSIGTRGSPLALAQAQEAAAALSASESLPLDLFPISIIRTSGDVIVDRPLSEAGGKGLFTKEIDEAQLSGRIDLSAHSAKDLPTILPEGLAIAGFLPRADPRDAFIGHAGARLSELAAGARIGTASLRRQAQLLKLRPDLDVRLIRGNVETRLAKVASGEFDGTLLALAGLDRLGLRDRATEILAPELFLPAVAQGAIALVARADHAEAMEIVARINHGETSLTVTAERAFLHELDGSCRTPIAGHAVLVDGVLILNALVLNLDGTKVVADVRSAPAAEAEALGRSLGRSIKASLPAEFFHSGSLD